ncbi:chaperone protein fimC precursor [Morganella psychrotolerans]|uniref:Chaperone protein fimC n=2 Tax=Morganella psychrotolerans TaxID=368603 RepID=A0A1B8HF17_9GAMM|nr:chaperone protein fimC precursor [Morganella psychrotolerans]
MIKNITYFIALYMICRLAYAGVVVGGTRFIYPQNKKVITIPVENTDDKRPYLIQSWVEDEDGINKTKGFIITPVIFQLNENKKSLLRVSLRQSDLKTDRETLFWLNVRGIPATESDSDNKLQVVINSKFKLFYRPTGLTEPDFNHIKYESAGRKIRVINETPYYITVKNIEINKKEYSVSDMIPPFEELIISASIIHGKDNIVINYIGDLGGVVSRPVVFRK